MQFFEAWNFAKTHASALLNEALTDAWKGWKRTLNTLETASYDGRFRRIDDSRSSVQNLSLTKRVQVASGKSTSSKKA
jgi:hypothetical protein